MNFVQLIVSDIRLIWNLINCNSFVLILLDSLLNWGPCLAEKLIGFANQLDSMLSLLSMYVAYVFYDAYSNEDSNPSFAYASF